jgi:hypothetical protein
MRSLPSLLFCLTLASAGAGAQVDGQTGRRAAASRGDAPTAEPAEGRQNQKIERIRIEDGGSRIDELRYGGQTQSITVQPKADVPEYGIQPPDLARVRPGDQRDGMGNAAGQRFWNVLKF